MSKKYLLLREGRTPQLIRGHKIGDHTILTCPGTFKDYGDGVYRWIADRNVVIKEFVRPRPGIAALLEDIDTLKTTETVTPKHRASKG